MRKLIVTTLAAVVATATIASSAAFAASPAYCNVYAQKAVWSEGQNLAESCGFVGPRWSFDFSGHYMWCLSVPKSVANSEKLARKWSLMGC